ncbi:MAG: TetR/AcrR family transcriptional regulator [Allosphingosinicella sp.]
MPSEESRAAAMDAARDLLIEAGPQAVTLKAVGARIGRTHANLLHHFGSAAGLQMALARHIAERVTVASGLSVALAREGKADPREIVERAFDAFDKEGAGQLAAWMILTGNSNALDPVLDAINRLVDQLVQGREGRPVAETTLWLVLAALGDSLLGGPMTAALGLPRGKAREVAARHLLATHPDIGRP